MAAAPRRLARRIRVAGGLSVSSRWLLPAAEGPAAVVFAHGAGQGMDSPFMRFFQNHWARGGCPVVSFNFPYMEAGRRAPDRAPRLLETLAAVVARVRRELPGLPVALAGKSMGARMATLLAARDGDFHRLVLLGYPLHPPRRPERRRDEHFPRIRTPALFLQGDRDPLCDLGLLRRSLRRLGGPWRLQVVAGGDHALRPARRTGRTVEEAWTEVGDRALEWLE